MADQRKLDLISEMVEQGKISVRAEPCRASYTDGYAASTNPNDNYYAVYCKPADIAQLQAKECLARTYRPRTDMGDLQKAYLNNDDPAALLALCNAEPLADPVFAAHDRAASIHALGLYHTHYPLEGTDGDSLSYLVLSADSDQHFRTAIMRLTNANDRDFLQMRHVGRKVGDFLLVPVRHSMAQAIKRAHPEAIEIEGDAATKMPVSVRSMQDIAARLHEDERFMVPFIEPAPKIKVVAEPIEKPLEEIKQLPLSELLDQLAPCVKHLERHEQIGGGMSTRLALQMNPGLQDILRRISNDKYCIGRGEFYISSVAGRAGSRVMVGINEASVQALLKHLPKIPQTTTVQPLLQDWLRSIPVQMNNDACNKQRMRITELRLARSEQDGEVQNWLVVTAPNMKRAEMLASQLSIGTERQRPITHGSEEPAIMLLPVTANVTESLITDRLPPLPRDETPHSSFEEMTNALRAHVTDRTLLSSLPTPLVTKVTKLPVAPVVRTNEKAMRENAAEILFKRTDASRRIWMHYARHQPGKSGKKQRQQLVCVGIALLGKDANQFETDIRATGFTDLPGRDFRYIGTTGKGDQKRYLFRLKLKPQDVAEWKDACADDTHWPGIKRDGQPRHLVMLTDKQAKDRLTRFMSSGPTHEKPEETAWRRLAALSNDGTIRCLQVRFSADDIRHIGQRYEDQLAAIDSVAASRKMLSLLRDEWRERGLPMHLHPVDGDVMKLDGQMRHANDSLHAMHGTVESITGGRKDYFRWLNHQPKNADGSVTLQYLVMPDPRNATLHHLRQAEHAHLDSGQGALFPQKPYVYERILSDNKELHMVPIGASFISQLAAHHGHLESMSNEPVMLSGLNGYLRGTFGKRPDEKLPYDHEAATTEMERARQQAARKRLAEQHFPKCRNYMLYGQLQPGNNPENFGTRPEHDRIGAQHGLLMHLNSNREWTQYVKPMLEEMQRAAMLDARKSYVMPLGAVDPALVAVSIAKIQASQAKLADVNFAIKQLESDASSAFNQNQLRDNLLNLVAPDDDMPEDLKPMIAEVAKLMRENGKDSARDAMRLVIQTSRQLERELQDRRNEQIEAEDTFQEALALARTHGMMKQEREPLFYLPGTKEGCTLNELDALVTKHFAARVSGSLTFATYLAPGGTQKGDFNDDNMIKLLKNAPPNLGQPADWANRVRRGLECPTNVTLDQFFAAGDRVFNGIKR